MTETSEPGNQRYQVRTGFQIAATFLAGAFLTPPDKAFLEGLRDFNLDEDWPFANENESSRLGIQYLNEFLENLSPDAETDLKADFTRLFIGLGHPLAPPYESVYRGDDRILFDGITLEVREFYRRFGLRIERPNKEPDDHIGYELSLIAFLCRQSLLARESNDLPQDLLTDKALASFLNDHIKTWAGEFIQALKMHAESGFYRGCAFLLEGFLKILGEYFSPPPR